MSEPLVSVNWLLRHLLQPDVQVVDVRWYLTEPSKGRMEYFEGHIPGAIFLDIEEDLSAEVGAGRHPLPEPAAFAELLGSKGISSEHRVIAYDDSTGAVAARLWWMLRHLGHEKASVLDGGYRSWTSAGYPSTPAVPELDPTIFEFSVRGGDTIDRDELRARLGEVLLVDARAAARYEGLEEPVDPVAGHIPTARSAPYEEFVREDGTVLDPDSLRARYEELGVLDAEEVVVYCGSGVTSCHHLLAMEVAGIEGVKLYPGGWSEWSTAGYPEANGAEPGAVPD